MNATHHEADATEETSAPHDPEIERLVLAEVLYDPDLGMPYCVEAGVDQNWFYETLHQVAWKAIAFRHGRRLPLDQHSVAAHLQIGSRGELNWHVVLSEIAAKSVSTGLLPGHLEILRDRMLKRHWLRVSIEMRQKANNGVTGDEMNGWISQLAANTTRTLQKASRAPGMDDLAIQATDRLEERLAGRSIGMMTGIACVDKYMRGMFPGRLYVIGGRPGTGKTAMAGTIGMLAAIRFMSAGSGSVVFMSQEMEDDEIFDRLLSAESGHNVFHTEQWTSPGTQEAVGHALEKLARIRRHLIIDATGALTISKLRARVHLNAASAPGGMKLLVIDYVQLVQNEQQRYGSSKREDVDKIVSEICDMAKEYQVPVIGLAQLNREFERDSGKGKSSGQRIPKKSDFRDSGMIEQSAQWAGILYPAEDPSTPGPRRVNLRVVKNRSGVSDMDCKLLFHGALSWFSDASVTPSGIPVDTTAFS